MAISRFGVSIKKELIARFDRFIRSEDYPTRSKAIEDLIREKLKNEEWTGLKPDSKKIVVGIITLVFNHHRRELQSKLTGIQHDFHRIIISTQHVHMDSENCLEIVVVKGAPVEVKKLASRLKAGKGVLDCSLTMSTTGRS